MTVILHGPSTHARPDPGRPRGHQPR